MCLVTGMMYNRDGDREVLFGRRFQCWQIVTPDLKTLNCVTGLLFAPEGRHALRYNRMESEICGMRSFQCETDCISDDLTVEMRRLFASLRCAR